MTSAARLLGSAALLLAVAEGFRTWTPPTAQRTSTTAVSAASPAGDDAAAAVSRRALGGQAARAAATAAGGLWALGLAGNAGVALAETTPAGVPYKVLKAGSGAQAKSGDLVAIRFRGSFDGKVFDDIFNTEEPYYVRVGSESLVKGIQDALPQMKVGDLWQLTLKSEFAFGPKGRPPSPGKPRIPGDAVVTYDVELISVPGGEGDLYLMD